MTETTPRQRQILEFITRHTRELGYPPTVREIGAVIGVRSTDTVSNHLLDLERKGLLTCVRGQARTLRVVAA